MTGFQKMALDLRTQLPALSKEESVMLKKLGAFRKAHGLK